jgi:hypothetical protein
MKHPDLPAIESRLLPMLNAARDELRTMYPDLRITSSSLPFEQATDATGHILELSVFFPDAPPEHPDVLELYVVLRGVAGPSPTVDAYVRRGYHGPVKFDLFPGSIPLSEAAIDRIVSSWPDLLRALHNAIRRR